MAGFGNPLTTPERRSAMKKILIFSVVRFAAFAVPIAIMCFVH